ncbi:LGFP repeat-containing protein [Actinokineospora spheciospongiae]|uniref:LGFP repeat-containing protein n=1 Tax=Actinokineospora spheciospongiae TaxID=909613 RepID=UPI000D70A820|nr:hypothetical protein [Actinokineospora spheciospongiae]PWW66728.1 LGFP repeat-containing protein [Actinokineospora spheciospongiae]
MLRPLTAVLTALLGTALAAAPAAAAPAIPGPLGTGFLPAACGVPANRDVAVTRKVYEVGQRRGVSAKVMLAGFEAGWVESHMNNLGCGDRDSLGVFQQRPSQGWGSAGQILDVGYAANKFFEVAQQLEPAYLGSTAGQLAQAVQRSAFPERYDQAQGIATAQRDEAFAPYGLIGDKYAALGGAGGVLGPPIRAEADARLGGRFTQFRNGMIIWHPGAPPRAVHGVILERYWATDSEVRWGFPTMDELPAAASPVGTRGRYQYFEKGLFLWSPATGAKAVHGAILGAFEAGGRERALGYPVTEEVARPGGGFDQTFESAVVHWTPAAGTWITPR